MITFIGFLVLVLGIVIVIISRINIQLDTLAWLKRFRVGQGVVLLFIGAVLMLLNSLFFFADRGFNYLLVYPTGKMSAVMEQGIKWRGFAKIDKWQKFIDVKVVGDGIEVDEKEVSGLMQPIPLRFIDQVTASGYVSSRFELPRDEESFIGLAVKFRTMSNLVNNTIVPTVKEQLVNTAYMFAAQDYISGEAQSFRQVFEEQLKEGAYAVEKIEKRDTVFASIQNEERSIKEIKTSYDVKRILEHGVPKRIDHELSENNIMDPGHCR